MSGSVGVGNLLDGVGSPIPLVGRDADNGARHPFLDGCHAATPTGDPASHCSFDAPVPDGQRWVIESFTSSCAVPTGSKLLFVELLLLTNGATGSWFSLPTFAGTDPTIASDRFILSEPLRLYADAATNPVVGLLTTDTSGKSICDFEGSGYLVKVP